MADLLQLSEHSLKLLRIHCSGYQLGAGSDDEMNKSYEELVAAGLMQVSDRGAGGEGSPRFYEPTDKGKRWNVVLGIRYRTARRPRGFWGIFRLRP